MATILPMRMCGNTTRQVDEWIQQLFTSGSVKIIDHAHREGNLANSHAEDVLLTRLHLEHNLTTKKGGGLKWDEKNKTVTLTQ